MFYDELLKKYSLKKTTYYILVNFLYRLVWSGGLQIMEICLPNDMNNIIMVNLSIRKRAI